MDKFPTDMRPRKKAQYSLPGNKPGQVNEPAVALAFTLEIPVSQLLAIDANRIEEPLARVATFRRGLGRKSFEKLKEVTGLDNEKLAMALAVSSKTLQRKQIFDIVQSEKMYELASLYSLGISYFGETGFRRWMERPLFSIGNRLPIDLIDVSEGITLLKDEIMRLQHGIAV